MANTFAYDAQIRRFLTQFIRALSHFQVEYGQDSLGNAALVTVPVYYGDSSQQVTQIIMGNSENTLPTVPAIACYISELKYDRERVQEPNFVSKVNIRERTYDPLNDTWGHTQGGTFTVERMMPAPYKITIKADIWTSNTNQKLQLWEQISPLFNPALEVQSTDNYIDWTSLSAIFLTDTVWTSRTIPVGQNQQIDIATFTFELPVWLSLPAKVKKLGVIEKIIMSIYDETGGLTPDIASLPTDALLARLVITPLNYGVIYFEDNIQLFGPQSVNDSLEEISLNTANTFSWKTLIDLYGGTITNGTTMLRLEQPNGNTLVGTVAYHPTEESMLIFNPDIDTFPSNTVENVDAIIDPYTVSVDSKLVSPPPPGTLTQYTRYLILNDIGSADNAAGAEAWKGTDGSDLIAHTNDIIEYDGVKWFVSFNAAGQDAVKYCTNLTTGIQYKWSPVNQTWTKSVEGTYQPGNWTIVLT